jgi:hypothetical protein
MTQTYKDGLLRAAEICDAVGARLSRGAGYACKIAADEIRAEAEQQPEEIVLRAALSALEKDKP